MNERYHAPSDLFCCPACGQPADMCRGHGPLGDPVGAQVLRQHACDNHLDCSPGGCVIAHEQLRASRARHPAFRVQPDEQP